MMELLTTAGYGLQLVTKAVAKMIKEFAGSKLIKTTFQVKTKRKKRRRKISRRREPKEMKEGRN